MRQKSPRVTFTGVVVILISGGFFAYMTSFAPRSSDPVELLRTVGQVSGAVGGLGLVMILYGLIGPRQPS